MRRNLIAALLAALASIAICGCQGSGAALATASASRTAGIPSPEARGRDRAAADIAAGKPRILYYGKPWSSDKPLIDDESGLPVEIVEGCVVTAKFAAETDAYSVAMRQWAGSRGQSSGDATSPAAEPAALTAGNTITKVASLAELRALGPIAVSNDWQLRLAWADSGDSSAYSKRLRQIALDSPDIEGQLSAALMVRAEADTSDALVAKVKPTLAWGQPDGPTKLGLPDCGCPDMMWIEDGTDGMPVFRVDRAYTWKPADQKARWVLLDKVDGDDATLVTEQVAGRSMPEVIHVKSERPGGDHPTSFALIKSTHPTGGMVYEVGWEVEMSGGTGHWETTRMLYVWRDAGGKWQLIGEGPEQTQGRLGGMAYMAIGIESNVQWRGDPARPIVSLVRSVWKLETGEGAIGLPDLTACRDAVLDATGEPLPTTFKWSKQDYIIAAEGDSLEKIIYRLELWQPGGMWDPYRQNPGEELLQKRDEILREWREELLRLNPILNETGAGKVPIGMRIVVGERIGKE